MHSSCVNLSCSVAFTGEKGGCIAWTMKFLNGKTAKVSEIQLGKRKEGERELEECVHEIRATLQRMCGAVMHIQLEEERT